MTDLRWTALLIAGAVVIVGLWAGVHYLSGGSAAPADKRAEPAPSAPVVVYPANEITMQLSSPAWPNEGVIPARFTCDGDDVSPPLNISGVPDGAQSLVLVADDPDAPRGDWVHWTVWNILPGTAEITEGMAPAGAVEGTTDFGKPGYGGPCPPSGEHRYQFKLYALDTTLDLSPSARKADIEQAMEGHILEQAALAGRYRRS